MAYRTTLLLDDETRTAARELALRYDCSTSEAIRRPVRGHREAVLGSRPTGRAKRVRTLERLFELFEGHDADREIRRLKEEDGGF